MPRRPSARRPAAAAAVLALVVVDACGLRPVEKAPSARLEPAPPPGRAPAAPATVPPVEDPAPPATVPPVDDFAPPATTPPAPASVPDEAPARYPPDAVHGPVTRGMVARWRRLAAAHPQRDDRMFLKAGASGTLNLHFFTCLAARPGPFPAVNWGSAPALAAAAAWFHPPADGRGRRDPFARRSLATEVSRTAGWALRGDPSPIEAELAATSARFAIVAFGTNDMVMAGTPRAALSAYTADLGRVADLLTAHGVIPILTGPGPRAHVPAIAPWVAVFDAATRAVAESRQVPYLSLEVLHRPLTGAGLARDGMHANTARTGGVNSPCAFDAEGLRYGYNARNLETLRALDAVRRAVAPGDAPPGDEPPTLAPPAAPALVGAGRPEAPFRLDALPFVHPGWLAAGGEARYVLDLPAATALRVELVAGRGSAFSLEVAAPAGEAPVGGRAPVRAGARFAEGTFSGGTWHLTVGRPATAGSEAGAARDYLLLVVPCAPGETACH
ncbi:SGNH/GDSL hydrolase family protein [Myxococcota bacterium]|nr:SGNH/GDSL hydrolase family protein [Myxococcota bacterium]